MNSLKEKERVKLTSNRGISVTLNEKATIALGKLFSVCHYVELTLTRGGELQLLRDD